MIHVSVSPVSDELLHCSSTFSFEVQGNVARTPEGIMMNGTAVACFHDPGTYRYVIEGLDRTLSGSIRIEEPSK